MIALPKTLHNAMRIFLAALSRADHSCARLLRAHALRALTLLVSACESNAPNLNYASTFADPIRRKSSRRTFAANFEPIDVIGIHECLERKRQGRGVAGKSDGCESCARSRNAASSANLNLEVHDVAFANMACTFQARAAKGRKQMRKSRSQQGSAASSKARKVRLIGLPFAALCGARRCRRCRSRGLHFAATDTDLRPPARCSLTHSLTRSPACLLHCLTPPARAAGHARTPRSRLAAGRAAQIARPMSRKRIS